MMNSWQARILRKRRTSRKFKKICQFCRQRPALSVRRVFVKKETGIMLGKRVVVKIRKNGLCEECIRSLTQSILAKQLVSAD